MVLLSFTTEVKGHIKDIFPLIANFGNVSLWDPGCISSKSLSNHPLDILAESSLETVFNGNKSKMIYKLIEIKKNVMVTQKGTGNY